MSVHPSHRPVALTGDRQSASTCTYDTLTADRKQCICCDLVRTGLLLDRASSIELHGQAGWSRTRPRRARRRRPVSVHAETRFLHNLPHDLRVVPRHREHDRRDLVCEE